MPVHHGFFVLFQFCEDFIGTHALGKQFLQNGFRFCFLCFFGGFLISNRLLGFQLGQFLLGGFEHCLFIFQISFQRVADGGIATARGWVNGLMRAAKARKVPVF